VEIGKRDLAKAETRAKAIVKRYPQRAIGYRLLADVARERGIKADALAGYQTAHATEPTTESAIRAYQAQLHFGSQAKAAAFMEAWLKAHPDDLLALRALADGYLQAKNLTAARSRYEDLLKRRGDDPYALNNLANVLLLLGDRSALARAERAHELAPQDAAIQDTLGWVLVQQGQVDLGLRHLREARLREPNNPEIRYHLAAALARAGRPGEARAELEQALKNSQHFDGASDARKLLGELSKS
jgi:Flp pilus assembly protein TadD